MPYKNPSDKKAYDKQYGKHYRKTHKAHVAKRNARWKANHPLYSVRHDMKQRCYNPNAQKYKRYGERGIKICDEWLSSFKAFENWCLDNGWQKGLTIDRIDNDGDYCPDNCQFITRSENSKRKSEGKEIASQG